MLRLFQQAFTVLGLVVNSESHVVVFSGSFLEEVCFICLQSSMQSSLR